MKKLWWLLIFLFLFLFYLLLHQLYFPRISAFGCFDDCFNYLAGFFLLKGKRLYSEIFFNHQPLMAYLSYFIQLFFQPINIYQLILRHRQFVFLFGFLMNGLLIWRFSLVGLGFTVFYELSKFYLFGDRFLGESLIVYPLVYLTGLVWNQLVQKKVYSWEYVLSAIFVWFVIFSRLPFVPLAIFLYGLLLFFGQWSKNKKLSLFLFLSFTLFILAFLPLKDYFFNLVIVNLQTGRFLDLGMIKSFFYPFYLLFKSKENLFYHFLLGLDLAFLLGVWGIKRIGLVWFLLALANLRVVEPGQVFYSAFHLLPWYGMLLWFTFLMIALLYQKKKWLGLTMMFFLVFNLLWFVFSPQFFGVEKIDPHQEFLTHFGHQLQVGEVVKVLSEPKDTLFLDGFDDLIYWQADRLSPYPYSWYTSVMPKIPQYQEARLAMFKNNPPDFYYGSCPEKKVAIWTMPKEFLKDYQQFYSQDKPTCLYVKKAKIPQISQEKWQRAKEFLYELPKTISVE